MRKIARQAALTVINEVLGKVPFNGGVEGEVEQEARKAVLEAVQKWKDRIQVKDQVKTV